MCTLIWCHLLNFVLSHSTLEEAQQINPNPAKKYRKKLRKEEGAIRLVGGDSNDSEGRHGDNNIRFYYFEKKKEKKYFKK